MQAYWLESSPFVATVRVLEFRASRGRGYDPLAVARVEIVKSIKGEISGIVEIVSLGGDQAANCGRASYLFQAASEQRLATLALNKADDGPNRFYTNGCAEVELGEFRSAENQ